ncbi:MFS general substrate transporter [Auriculariales sp. MPI-PUGE-AT-0066]|nr:MFS general substrate transporter [Auriculariales sp. MPI-PUGE-AT-0066]
MSAVFSRQPEPAELEPLVPAAQRKETPLPKLQLGILCLVRLAEPIAYTQIFPYVNRMMEWLRVTDNPSRIGTYSGLVESVFAFAQLLFIFQWAKLSDRVGRKPVILCGLAGSAVSTLLFGMAGSLPSSVSAGGLAGNVAVIQSMVGEITDETNQARAFPILSLCWNLGCIIGPLIGGTLSDPATRYPEIFGDIQYLKDRPFFLPCALSSSLTLCSIVLGYFTLTETLPSKVQKQNIADGTATPNYGAITAPVPAEPAPDVSMKSLLRDPTIISVVRSYFVLSLNGSSIDVLFVLLAYTAISLGGLARTPQEIGFALSFSGLIAAIMGPIFFPWLTKRIPIKKLYPRLMSFYPVVFLTLPCLNAIAKAYLVPGTDNEISKRGQAILWTALAVPLFLTASPTSPSREALGRTFGIGQTIAAISRGIAPTLSSTLFALTTEHHLLGGWLVWLVMASIGILGIFTARAVKDGVEERKKHEMTSGSS